MALADPYAPCPCGSGQKFKWCCQKAEPVAERAQRLAESDQFPLAIEALDEGLRKEPGTALLLIRKALYLVHEKKLGPALEALRLVVQTQPGHVVAQSLLIQLELDGEGSEAGVARLQQALSAVDRELRPKLAGLAGRVASYLAEEGLFAAALKHAELQDQLAKDAGGGDSLLARLERNAAIPSWQKNPYRLAEAREGLRQDQWARFSEALQWAREGLWSSAAASFELLSAAGAGPEADRNLGLCRLWLGDHEAAVAALRRSIARAGAATEAVDIEALCQQIAPPGQDEMVEQVHWIWPLRDRGALLQALGNDPRCHEEESGPIDEKDPDSAIVARFALLDVPAVAAAPGLAANTIPRIVGRVLVGQEIALLEGFDDGRLDALSERFKALAGAAIKPAHPRTKVLGKVQRSVVALTWEWLLPEGIERDEAARLTREQTARIITTVWPETPMPFLRGRTPLAAAAAGDAEVPLRAAVMQLEQGLGRTISDLDFAAFRARLKLPQEPAVEPDTVDLEALHLARLALVPAERLSDDRLIAFYILARSTMQMAAVARAARLLIERASSALRARIEPMVLHADLANCAAENGDMAEGFDWIRRGRAADPLSARASNAPMWDMFEIQLKTRSEPPESWVPALAVVIGRYENDAPGREKIFRSLIEMGLMRLVASPERPQEVMVNSRPLQALLATYGPRVTTASGELGVAAAKSEIWTPGSATGGGSLWTPGSAAAGAPQGGDKPKLIIPGR